MSVILRLQHILYNRNQRSGDINSLVENYNHINLDMSNVTDNQINLYKLKTLIDSGIASIPSDKNHQNAVLVIGDTGVGKTTILSFLAKRKLFIKIHGLNTILDSQDQDGLKIGHDKFSETRVPSKIIIDKMVFFDCSGFKDNRGEEYEISNSFFVQRLFDIYQNIKILLIVDESSISQSRADKLPKLIRNLLKSFSQLSDIQDGVILLINRAKPQFSEKVYSEQLLKMSKLKNQDGYMFNQQERNFIDFLVKNKRICLFKQAQKQDQGKVLDIKQENLMNLIRDTHFVKSKKIKNIISESAKLSIRELVDHLADQGEPKIQKLCLQIIKNFSYKSYTNFTDAISIARETKKSVAQFTKSIQKSSDAELIETIKSSVTSDVSSFENDVSAVLFFKNIYNKSDYYFKLIRSSLASTLSKMLLQIDEDIAGLEKQQKVLNDLTEKAVEASKRQQVLAKQLEAFKLKQEEYKLKIAEQNKIHTQKINELEILSDEKDQSIADLHAQIQKLTEEYTNFKNELATKDKKQADLKKSVDQRARQVEELTKLIANLKVETNEHLQEIELLHEENANLKVNLDEVVQQSQKGQSASSSLNTSKISSMSKYPDVVCPHLKNNGKCVHCIKAWKLEQKKLKQQQKI